MAQPSPHPPVAPCPCQGNIGVPPAQPRPAASPCLCLTAGSLRHCAQPTLQAYTCPRTFACAVPSFWNATAPEIHIVQELILFWSLPKYFPFQAALSDGPTYNPTSISLHLFTLFYLCSQHLSLPEGSGDTSVTHTHAVYTSANMHTHTRHGPRRCTLWIHLPHENTTPCTSGLCYFTAVFLAPRKCQMHNRCSVNN